MCTTYKHIHNAILHGACGSCTSWVHTRLWRVAQFSHIDPPHARLPNPLPHHRRPGGPAPTSRTGAGSAVVASAGSAAPVAALMHRWCVGTASAHAQRNRPCRRYRCRPCCLLLMGRLNPCPASARPPTAPTAGALPATLAAVIVPVAVITHLVLSPVVLTNTMGLQAREVVVVNQSLTHLSALEYPPTSACMAITPPQTATTLVHIHTCHPHTTRSRWTLTA